MTSTYLQFDDADPALEYSSNWVHHTDISGTFNGTLSATAILGETVRIPFYAAQIVIVGATVAPPGAKNDSGPISLYTLDGAKNTGTLYQADMANATDVTFFTSGPLEIKKHTLDITILSISEGVPFFFDYLALGQPQEVPTSTAVWMTTEFVTPTSTPTSVLDRGKAAGNTNVSESSLPVGAIVGGVIGGVALLTAALLAFYFLHWRRRTNHYDYHTFPGVALFDAEKEYLTAPRHDAHQSQSESYSDTPPDSGFRGGTAPPRTGTPRAAEFGASSPALPPSSSSSSPSPSPGAPQHSYPPRTQSDASASVYSQASGRSLVFANSDPAPLPPPLGPLPETRVSAPASALTPAQRKAREAYQRSEQQRQVQFHADSGRRFDGKESPVVASGSSGAGAGSSASASAERPGQAGADEVLGDVPPEYSER